MLLPFDALEKIAWSVLVSIGFAVLFKTPRRALWVVGLLGGIGCGIKTILLHSIMPEQVIFASLAGASAVGVGRLSEWAPQLWENWRGWFGYAPCRNNCNADDAD